MTLAQWLIIFGIALIAIGSIIWLGFPFGKLPGDFSIKGEKTQVYFPLATSIVISLVLTIILNLIFWLIRK